MILYNCKVDGDQHRITKFDSDGNVEASYLTTHRECECPAGHRDTCRHRLMLPRFLAKPGADKGLWFYNYDHKQWIAAEAEVEFEASDESLTQSDSQPNETLAESAARHGFTMLDLADPAKVHNAIAEAVGEPKLAAPAGTTVSPSPSVSPSPTDIRRRL